MAVVNAILMTGNRVVASISGGTAPTGNDLQKSLENLRKIMLPHEAESSKARVKNIKKTLEREAARGKMQIKVMGGSTAAEKQRVRIRKK